MTGLYLYCVGRSDHPGPEGLEGIGGAPVRSLELGGMSAWVSPLESAPAASLDLIRTHNEVVETSMKESTPLPMRFGQWFASEAELAEVLSGRRDALERGLERVRGALEYGVRVLDPSLPKLSVPDRTTGRAYLEGLARREEEAERSLRRGAELAVAMRSFLGALVREQAVRPGRAGALVAVAHLVARHDTGNYGTRVRTFAETRPDLRFVLSGPWPPYGFVDDGP